MVKKEETRVVWVLTTVVLWMLVYEVGEGWRDYGSRLVDFGDLGLILGGCMVLLGLVVSSIAIRSKLVMGEKGVGGRIAQALCPHVVPLVCCLERLVLGGCLSRARGSANSALQLWWREGY
ncbi:hypothetical protein NC652_032361 [Populus alba x Populus x berolinensis]|nr:hypothetical protein NC652_032361 [Populus alba x Populus x berolinensis]